MLNGLRGRFPALDVETPIRRLSAPGSRGVALLRLAAGHPLAAESGLVLLLNPDPQQPVSLAGERLMSETGGLLGQFTDVTPDRAPKTLAPGQPLTLEPLELRIFEGRRETPTGSRRKSHDLPPIQGDRVVIENPSPEIDGGRHPGKGILGDLLAVEADIFIDGHGHVAARARYRQEGAPDWQEAPMVLVENDRWRAELPLTRLGRWVFTIEAWPDEFETWRSDVAKKLAAGQKIDLDIREGLDLLRRAAATGTGTASARIAKILAAVEAAEDASEKERLVLSEELQSLMAEAGDRRGLDALSGRAHDRGRASGRPVFGLVRALSALGAAGGEGERRLRGCDPAPALCPRSGVRRALLSRRSIPSAGPTARAATTA